jgi:hypothetical protein
MAPSGGPQCHSAGIAMEEKTNVESGRVGPDTLVIDANDGCLGYIPSADEVGVNICWKLL